MNVRRRGVPAGPQREAYGRNALMNGHGKSDSPIVPGKFPNKAEKAAEGMEGRGLAKGNPLGQNTLRIQGRVSVHSALERVRKAAKRDRKQRLTALFHHAYDIDVLRESYFALPRDAAPGVDGETWRRYGEDLEANLQDLSERLRPASSAGGAAKGAPDEEGELGAGRRPAVVFRYSPTRLVGEVCRAPDWGPAHRAADPEMAQGRGGVDPRTPTCRESPSRPRRRSGRSSSRSPLLPTSVRHERIRRVRRVTGSGLSESLLISDRNACFKRCLTSVSRASCTKSCFFSS